MKRCSVRPILFLTFFCSLVGICSVPGISLGSQSDHRQYVFFENTQYPLRVHFIRGERPGPTIMIQGGIQGDEDAGFIAGQILSRTKVDVGNLIVVPRADVPSINVHQREFNVDLNRRFDKDYDRFFEDRLARVIRFLIGKCDGFIHLHEGSGFYNPTHIDNLHGPHRYGQSVIIDTDVFADKLFLANMAENVLNKVNKHIVPRKWGFRLFNTKTFSSCTKYPEQQKSLSFYAVKQLNIPALAVEVSKDINDLDWKVRRQIEVVSGLLEEFGVECTVPDIGSGEIKEWYSSLLPLRINDTSVGKGAVTLTAYTPFTVSLPSSARSGGEREYAVYASGREGYNLLNSEYIPLVPFKWLEVLVDGKVVRKIPVRWKGKWSSKRSTDNSIWVYSLNDKIHYSPSGSIIDVFEGDQLILEGIWHGKKDEILNIKGFVADKRKNTGQDAEIPLMIGKANFITKYLDEETRNYWQFRAVRETHGTSRDVLRFKVLPRSVKALELLDTKACKTIVPISSDIVAVRAGTYRINDIWTQRDVDDTMIMVDAWPVSSLQDMVWKPGESHVLSVYGARDFKPIHDMRIHVSEPLVSDAAWALEKRSMVSEK